MIRTAKTAREARKIAAELRAIFVGTDWAITVNRPLFAGDVFRIVVD